MNRVAFSGGLLGARNCTLDQLESYLERYYSIDWLAPERGTAAELATALYELRSLVAEYFGADTETLVLAVALLRRYVRTPYARAAAYDDERVITKAPLPAPALDSHFDASAPLNEAAVVCARLASIVVSDALEALTLYTTLEQESVYEAEALGRREADVLRALDSRLLVPTLYDFYALVDCDAWSPELVQRAGIDARAARVARQRLHLWLFFASIDADAHDPAVEALAVLALVSDAALGRASAYEVVDRVAARYAFDVDSALARANELLDDVDSLSAYETEQLRQTPQVRELRSYARIAERFVLGADGPGSPATPLKRRRTSGGRREMTSDLVDARSPRARARWVARAAS